MSEIKEALTEKDEHGQIGLDQFDQIVCDRVEDGIGTCRTWVTDVRGKTCPLCGREWEITTKDWADQFYHHDRELLMHKSCFVRHLTHTEHMDWFNAIVASRKACPGLRFEKPEEIKNQYGGAWNTPWYRVRIKSHNATLILGRRKRVDHVEIQFDEPTQKAIDKLTELFADYNVTKGYVAADEGRVWAGAHIARYKLDTEFVGFYAHAWGENYKDYLMKFAEVMLMPVEA